MNIVLIVGALLLFGAGKNFGINSLADKVFFFPIITWASLVGLGLLYVVFAFYSLLKAY